MADQSRPRSPRGEVETVRNYLRALREHRPRRGRPRTPERVEAQLREVETEIESTEQADDPLRLLALVQRRLELTAELERLRTRDSLQNLAEQFVEVVASYSERKGISYDAWRALGVPAEVLRRGGVDDAPVRRPTV